ncbi:caspase family protein [uncultured Psychroserpens sp.]|uniref:caspase family protein n=1 Tax=uncultured Psychroserpens sp. TaxID=255436 RepID=UPI002608F5FA|nr:caspase family protein [uncultured Psychroserpens sp.]
MKKLLLIFSICLICNAIHSQSKKAFIVGVSNYKDANLGWDNISGEEDAHYIESFLIHTLQFKSSDIHSLINEDAKKADVLNQLNSFAEALDDSTEFVFLYFATHGQQISDSNNDETLDALDEALVLHNTPKAQEHAPNNYKGELHLIDDELQPIILKIRQNISKKGHVFMGVDACFSATSDKGDDVTPVRGTHENFIFKEATKSPKDDTEELKELLSSDTDLAPFVIISGSQANQVNMQYSNNMGSLTYALTAAYKKVRPEDNWSYEYFFKYIKEEYKTVQEKNLSQKPVMTGHIEHSIFTSSGISHPYFLTSFFNKRYKTTSKNLLTLPFGRIHGYAPGMLFKIINRANDEVLAYGKVTNANEVKSYSVCSNDLTKPELNNAIFIPIQLNYLTDNFKISVEKKDENRIQNLLKIKSIEELKDSASDFKLTVKNGLFSIQLLDRMIIENRAIEDLEYGLIYASYIQYLYLMDKETRTVDLKNKPLSKDFSFDTSNPNTLIIHSNNSSYFYNVADMFPSFSVEYPNAIYRNDELFMSNRPKRKQSLNIAFESNSKKLIVLEKQSKDVSSGAVFPNLNLDKSLFNYDFFKLKDEIPKHIIFPKKVDSIGSQRNFLLLILNEGSLN